MNITILAVTKREYGVCIAGVDENLNWVRPVKKRTLRLNDIKLGDNEYISNSCVYDILLRKDAPNGYQTENYLIDEKQPIKYLRKLDDVERDKLFSAKSENSLLTSNTNTNILNLLKEKNESLILLGPVTIDSVSLSKDEDVHVRVDFSVGPIKIKNQHLKGLPCTDLKFLSFAKNILDQENTSYLRLSGEDIKNILRVDNIFIVIGLTAEPFQGDYWPMIIGVHTIPDYQQNVEFNGLCAIEKVNNSVQSAKTNKEELDPNLIEEYYKIKKELSSLTKREEELKGEIKSFMGANNLDHYDNEKISLFYRKSERISYPKDKVEEFVPAEILEKIKLIKEVAYLLTTIKK